MRLGKRSTKRGNIEAKFENQSTFFKPNSFKKSEKSLAFKEKKSR